MPRFRADARRQELLPLIGVLAVLGIVAAMPVLALGCCQPGQDVPEDQSWTGGNWSVEVLEEKWSGCFLYITLRIIHTGDRTANFGYNYDDASLGSGSLYMKDKYGSTFEEYLPYPWQEPFYEDSFYPDEFREGISEFKIDPRSEHVWMFMRPEYEDVENLSFDLGDVPESCRR